MSSLGLTQEELKAVEQTRQRLSQLSSTILSLKNDVYNSITLPNLGSLQASADILQLNLGAIQEVIAQHNDLFSRIATHPSTNFPGRTQENILLQLLRKKPEPEVEAIMEEGRQTLARLITPPKEDPPPQGGVAAAALSQAQQQKEDELENAWAATRSHCSHRIFVYATEEESDPFTHEEHENGIHSVRTGLKRDFDDDDEEEEGSVETGGAAGGAGMSAVNRGDNDVMVVDRPPPPPAPAVTTQEVEGSSVDNVMRVTARGQTGGPPKRLRTQ